MIKEVSCCLAIQLGSDPIQLLLASLPDQRSIFCFRPRHRHRLKKRLTQFHTVRRSKGYIRHLIPPNLYDHRLNGAQFTCTSPSVHRHDKSASVSARDNIGGRGLT